MKILLTITLSICMSVGFAQNDLTNELEGVNMTYKYSGGNSYNVKFENGSVSYRFLTGSKPETWWGPFPYSATKTENNEYFLSWFEEGYGDYVTLLLNPESNSIIGSALIVKGDAKKVHFQKATISEFIK